MHGNNHCSHHSRWHQKVDLASHEVTAAILTMYAETP